MTENFKATHYQIFGLDGLRALAVSRLLGDAQELPNHGRGATPPPASLALFAVLMQLAV